MICGDFSPNLRPYQGVNLEFDNNNHVLYFDHSYQISGLFIFFKAQENYIKCYVWIFIWSIDYLIVVLSINYYFSNLLPFFFFFFFVKCVLYFNQALACALLFASKLWRPLRLSAPHTFTNHCYALKSLTIHLLLRLHIERNRIALQTPQDAFQNSKRLTYQKRKKSKHLEHHLASWKEEKQGSSSWSYCTYLLTFNKFFFW